jgi:hypothetical protein
VCSGAPGGKGERVRIKLHYYYASDVCIGIREWTWHEEEEAGFGTVLFRVFDTYFIVCFAEEGLQGGRT